MRRRQPPAALPLAAYDQAARWEIAELRWLEAREVKGQAILDRQAMELAVAEGPLKPAETPPKRDELAAALASLGARQVADKSLEVTGG